MAINFPQHKTLNAEQIETGDVFAPKFDSKGLIVAIATDASTSAVLMVAYMNAEALSLTLETGIVHYFSRSRAKLWKKGETSGELQKLVELRTDCDQDVILLKVEQTGRGAACHTGRRSCFYRRVELENSGIKMVRDTEPPLFDPKEVY